MEDNKQLQKGFDENQKKAFYQLLIFSVFIVAAIVMIAARPADSLKKGSPQTDSPYLTLLQKHYNYAFSMRFSLPDGSVLTFDGKRNGRKMTAIDQDHTEYFIETVNTYSKKEGEEEYSLLDEENSYLTRFSLEQMLVLLEGSTLDYTSEEAQKTIKKYHYDDVTMVSTESNQDYELILQMEEFTLQILYYQVDEIEELSM